MAEWLTHWRSDLEVVAVSVKLSSQSIEPGGDETNIGGSHVLRHRGFRAANYRSSFSHSEPSSQIILCVKSPKSGRHVCLTSENKANERKTGGFRAKPSK